MHLRVPVGIALAFFLGERSSLSDAQPVSTTGCPEDFVPFQYYCYKFEQRRWGGGSSKSEAREACEESGASLLSLHSEDEWAFLEGEFRRGRYEPLWIGANMISPTSSSSSSSSPSSSVTVEESRHRNLTWDDGTPFFFGSQLYSQTAPRPVDIWARQTGFAACAVVQAPLERQTGQQDEFRVSLMPCQLDQRGQICKVLRQPWQGQGGEDGLEPLSLRVALRSLRLDLLKDQLDTLDADVRSQSGWAVRELLEMRTEALKQRKEFNPHKAALALRLMASYGVPVDEPGETNITALAKAAASAGDVLLTRTLLDLGADPNRNFPDGSTLLHAVARGANSNLGDLEGVVATLARGGAVVDALDQNSMSPLLVAAGVGRSGARVVKALARAGGLVTLRDQDGNSPLHLAARAGSVQSLKELLRAGANLEARNDKGETPLFSVASSLSRSDFRLEWESMDALLEAGADINARDVRGDTPFMHALFVGSTAVAKYLLDYGADPGARNKNGQTFNDLGSCVAELADCLPFDYSSCSSPEAKGGFADVNPLAFFSRTFWRFNNFTTAYQIEHTPQYVLPSSALSPLLTTTLAEAASPAGENGTESAAALPATGNALIDDLLARLQQEGSEDARSTLSSILGSPPRDSPSDSSASIRSSSLPAAAAAASSQSSDTSSWYLTREGQIWSILDAPRLTRPTVRGRESKMAAHSEPLPFFWSMGDWSKIDTFYMQCPGLDPETVEGTIENEDLEGNSVVYFPFKVEIRCGQKAFESGSVTYNHPPGPKRCEEEEEEEEQVSTPSSASSADTPSPSPSPSPSLEASSVTAEEEEEAPAAAAFSGPLKEGSSSPDAPSRPAEMNNAVSVSSTAVSAEDKPEMGARVGVQGMGGAAKLASQPPSPPPSPEAPMGGQTEQPQPPVMLETMPVISESPAASSGPSRALRATPSSLDHAAAEGGAGLEDWTRRLADIMKLPS
uniref:C-type lectin domain-containing protein n=1 Tax=Chromera velia CCMP2878 TaxID=1169474 RepID=A0A0G4I1H1_9ALVE|eukprot:Cvel_10132.t1-p1 / transcript=Cvel_10132.t1 / gene=Cvel_10132 / organism=Chromera_velia_CCMP2878 / gene_product=Ankyrin-3, putative / transcript_product=Ankyrin-3, putative / location=Cvel_scaffold604:18038-23583(+) / protein_length=965 / sequence_SO=supercontig / SO=protein_coding / is_pseudo=false